MAVPHTGSQETKGTVIVFFFTYYNIYTLSPKVFHLLQA